MYLVFALYNAVMKNILQDIFLSFHDNSEIIFLSQVNKDLLWHKVIHLILIFVLQLHVFINFLTQLLLSLMKEKYITD
jgi:hypothetical protein